MGYQVADAGHLAPGATFTTPQTVQGSELMRYAAVGDATLLIGGDLTVTVFEVLICLAGSHLVGMVMAKHAFVGTG